MGVVTDPTLGKLSPRQTYRPSKINLQNVACFSTLNQSHLWHHVSDAFHHNFTIKTPPQKHAFSQNPIKMRP